MPVHQLYAEFKVIDTTKFNNPRTLVDYKIMPSSKWVSEIQRLGGFCILQRWKKRTSTWGSFPPTSSPTRSTASTWSWFLMIKIVHLFFGNSMFDLPLFYWRFGKVSIILPLYKKEKTTYINQIWGASLMLVDTSIFKKGLDFSTHKAYSLGSPCCCEGSRAPPNTTAPSMESPPIVSPRRKNETWKTSRGNCEFLGFIQVAQVVSKAKFPRFSKDEV